MRFLTSRLSRVSVFITVAVFLLHFPAQAPSEEPNFHGQRLFHLAKDLGRTTMTPGGSLPGGSWKSIGPFGFGAGILSIAIDPSSSTTLYVGLSEGATGGVFKSNDGGATWTASREGLPLPVASVAALEIDPFSPTTLYAGTAGAGVFKSTDGGRSWFPANGGISDAWVVAIAIDPRVPGTLYAAAAAVSGNGGVFKTTDGGGQWVSVDGGWPARFFRALVVDPSSPGTVYLGTLAGVQKTTNGGQSWSPVNEGLLRPSVQTLAIDPLTPSTLYAGTVVGGVFKTVNGGANWSAASEGLPAFSSVRELAIDPSFPTTLYALSDRGVFRSADGGGSWQARTPVSLDLSGTTSALAIAPGETAVYAAVTDSERRGRLFKSRDRAESWAPLGPGVGGLSVNDIAIDSSRGALYAATDSHGVFRSFDGGTRWAAANNGLEEPRVTALQIAGRSPQALFAGTQSRGVFRSSDGGDSWSPLNTGLDTLTVSALAVDPVLSSFLYVGGPGGIFKSSNEGGSWIRIFDQAVSVIAVAPDSTIYAGGAGRIYKGAQAGSRWTTVFSNSNEAVTALEADPVNPSRIYAGTRYTGPSPGGPQPGLVLKSEDAGENWTTVLTSLEIESLAIDSARPSTIYAGGLKYRASGLLGGGGVFRSDNAGAGWQIVNDGLPNNALISALEVTLGSSPVYAGTTGGGLYRADSPRSQDLCEPTPTSLCLNGGRFRVEVAWRAPQGGSGRGQSQPLTSDTGAFWFFQPSNLELVVKVLDGRSVNGKFWVFYGALSNVEYTVSVTDMQTGARKPYANPQGRLASVADTEAF